MKKKRLTFDVVGAVIEKRGRILVCQRLKDDLFGSQWEFPGGKVEKGEEKRAALKRELKEELGLRIKPGRLIATFEDELPSITPRLYSAKEKEVIQQGGMKIKVYLYSCAITAAAPRCIECQNLKWATIAEIGTLKLAPADRKIYNFLRNEAPRAKAQGF